LAASHPVLLSVGREENQEHRGGPEYEEVESALIPSISQCYGLKVSMVFGDGAFGR
jgi:hypothetical protein